MRHDPAMFHKARVLRQVPLPIEAHLWQNLRDRRFRGLKFRRQAVVAGRVVAFLCASRRVVILVDGGEQGNIHATRALQQVGLCVIVPDAADPPGGSASVLQRLAAALDRQDGKVTGTG